ncbi:ABC transporter substrate-binding protein [Tepidicella baoligensis]|uniref:ABC transporter substrate-binding protein n=1 Tax=Tepidicella baoligensis TaxID=2707016 RepID=UPI0015DB846D|nr:ABC transporter substrate-binding protein [Tepidicella baoligensis]
MKFTKALLSATILATATAAMADVKIGVILPLTGPASGLGIPAKNQIALWPTTIAGEKLQVTILDDATDPTNGVKNARRFTTEDKVDLIVGSVATPVGVAIADVALDTKTPQLALTPIGLPPGKDAWSFRMPQSNGVMATAIVSHMQKLGIKSVGYLGYTDAYGEQWLQAFTPLAEKAGIQIVGVERFARNDTSVTAQALKLVAANPDAMLIVASGSGAAMPHKSIVERGFKGKIYQTHGAATKDLMRVGGKDVEGAFVVAGPVIAPSQLPDSNPSKKIAMDFAQQYDKAYGAGTANQFAGHAHDVVLVLEKALPIALKKAKPGTPEFRTALRDAFETMGPTVVAHGTLNWTKDDHWGYTPDTGVIYKVVNGDWKFEK